MSATAARRHWLLKWLSSAALVPLSFWLLYSFAGNGLRDADAFGAWLREPGAAGLLGLFFLVSLYHSWLGLGTIIDDYVSSSGSNRFAHQACAALLLVILALAFLGIGKLL